MLPGGRAAASALPRPRQGDRGARASSRRGRPLGYSSGQRLPRALAADGSRSRASFQGGPSRRPGRPPQQQPAPPGRLVIAISTADVNSTLARLDRLELVIGLVVVAIAGAVAWALVRVELRPLVRIEDTAAAIAAGDLSRRVDAGDPATEVGSLGASLNAMLAQIEAAFEERRASENRLRRFVADAGHELRTPLTSVRGYAELFRRGGAARSGRPGDDHVPDRVRGAADGGAGRGPAAAGQARPGPAARAPAGAAERDRRRDGRRSGHAASRLAGAAAHRAGSRGGRRRAAHPPGRRQPARERPRPHPARHARHGHRGDARRDGHGRGGRRRARACRPR